MIDTQQDKTNTLLHANASSAALVFVLKFMFGIWLIRYAIDPLQQISALPLGYSNPVGLLRCTPLWIYEAIHSYAGLLLLRTLIVTACAGVWFARTRLASAWVGCVLITIAASVSRGFGHINHAEIGPLLITWVLVIFASRLPAESLKNPSHDRCQTSSTGLVTATIVLSLVYALVGVARITNGGLPLLAGDTITNRLVHMSAHDWLVDFNFSELMVAHPWMLLMLKLGTAAVTVVEIATPFAMISRRVRYTVLVLMPMFHLGAIFAFKVVFIEQPLCLILLLSLSPMLKANSEASETNQTNLFSRLCNNLFGKLSPVPASKNAS